MTTRRPIEPWFAHEHPDRPLVQGSLEWRGLATVPDLGDGGSDFDEPRW
jgi:hypothetical protein